MTIVRPPDNMPEPETCLRLLVELPSWSRVFLGNLRELVFPQRLPPLETRSAPGRYWPDVFVRRELPWNSLLKSLACHVIALALLVGFTQFFSLRPQVVAQTTFGHAQVVYYEPTAYLPPIDTRNAEAAQPRKADPEFSRQPIISVPPEADNRSQTIVTPPDIKLKRDVRLPNVVAWSESEKMEKPKLAIPPAPLTLAADTSRMPPELQSSVVTPPPDAAHLAHRRDSPTLREAVVAPPPDLRAANTATAMEPLQAAVVAPPPSVDIASTRPAGDLNIGRSSVIAPAPELPVAEQRAIAGGRSSSIGSQVLPPPPSLAGAGASPQMGGARGHFIALNLHPAVGAPPEPPAGNRRGAFAATPGGHVGASGSPGSEAAANGTGTGSARKGRGDPSNLPAGLYVGSAGVRPSAVAGDAAAENSVNPNLVASVRPPRVTTAPQPMQAESTSKLSEAERAVFGDRKFYSLRLNIPNLNSNGGSWVIRFAELDKDSNARDANHSGANKFGAGHNDPGSAGELSQPVARRTVDPAYPMQLMRKNVAGTVILYAVIRADGTVGNVRVLRGVDDRLDQFASQAVAQWQFQPAMKNGVPVDVDATFQVPFRPGRVGSSYSW